MILLVPLPFPIAAMIVLAPLIVIGALAVAVSDRLRQRKPMTQPHGLLGKAYRPTLILIGVGGLVIFALVMAL
jgi:hypothetical protein